MCDGGGAAPAFASSAARPFLLLSPRQLATPCHGHDFGCPLSKIVLQHADTRYVMKTTLFTF